MNKYNEKISADSVWITATPTLTTLTLPFYVTETGHFYAAPDYGVERTAHDSFLFLYTLKGCGSIQSGDAAVRLPVNHAVVIDCHEFHRYRPEESCEWEFIWLHIKGNAVTSFFELLYPNGIYSVEVHEPESLTAQAGEIIAGTEKNDIVSVTELSSRIHEIFNILIKSSMRNEEERGRGRYYEFVRAAAERIRQQYSRSLTIDDIMENIPMSKYHFIRTFKRIMGTTPYNYLMNYRINNAKILLRTTDMPVADISEGCGFLDTSNFITQFKKHTQQKPLQYRHYFSGSR